MHRIVIPFFLFVHVLPFFYFFDGSRWIEYSVLLLLQAAFLLGVLVVRVAMPKPMTSSVDPDLPPYRSAATLYFVFGIYLVFRWIFITRVVEALMDGTYLTYALSLAADRYANGEQEIAPFFNVGTTMFFAFAMLFGSFAPRQKGGHRRLFTALFCVSLLIESSSLARAGILIALVSFVTELLIRNNQVFYRARLAKVWSYLGGAGLIAMLILVVIGYLRIRYAEDAFRILLVEKIPGYTLASYGALLVWMHSVPDYGYAFGYYTFSFFFKMMSVSVPQGMYDLVDTSVGPTNIFMIYRGLLADFGIVGAALTMFSFGFTIMYSSIKRPAALRYFFLRFALVMVLYPVYSIFIFSTVAAAFVLSYMLIIGEWLEWSPSWRARKSTPAFVDRLA